MKHARLTAAKPRARRVLNTVGCVRIASLLTVGAMIVVLPTLIFSGDPQIWLAAGPLCIFTIGFIWSITLLIGWFVMMAVAICRIGRRFHRPNLVEHGQVWDRWMDGPEPRLP